MLYEGFQCEGYELAADAPLVTGLMDAAARATGRRPPLYASTATTDARTISCTAIRPRSASARRRREHAVDERVHLPSVTETAQALALFIRDWCGLARADPSLRGNDEAGIARIVTPHSWRRAVVAVSLVP